MNTLGDIDQIKPLTAFDSKGVFTKELDIALLSNHITLAVHCMKDLPTTLPHGLCKKRNITQQTQQKETDYQCANNLTRK